jgi:hypothetical protein
VNHAIRSYEFANMMLILSFILTQFPVLLPQPVTIFPPVLMPGMVPNARPLAPSATVATDASTMQARTKQLHQSYLRALQQAYEESSNSIDTPKTTVTTTAPPLSQQITEIPDLLSGFEKVVQCMKPAPQAAQNEEPEEYSPPFTSRSFDEFHRFLGKEELPLLDAATTTCTGPESSDVTTNRNLHVTASAIGNNDIVVPNSLAHDTAALFTAESYAMLAQASAMEASRHGAYSMSLPSGNTFDIENVLQQVGLHHRLRGRIHKNEDPSMHTSSNAFPNSCHPVVVDVAVTQHSTKSNLPLVHTTAADIKASSMMTHITATSRCDTNIVSGSEPSGSSSSRSNTSNTSSGSDTAGTSNDDCSDEGEGAGSCYTSSSGCASDSADYDDPPIPPHRKKVKVDKPPQQGFGEKRKKVQFQ